MDRIIHTRSRSLIQRRETREVRYGSRPRLDIDVDVPDRPEHAVSDLVAEGDDVEVDTCLLEGDERGFDVGSEG
jgi:hypothetical protein